MARRRSVLGSTSREHFERGREAAGSAVVNATQSRRRAEDGDCAGALSSLMTATSHKDQARTEFFTHAKLFRTDPIGGEFSKASGAVKAATLTFRKRCLR